MSHLSTQTSESPLIGKPAPDAVLTKTDGTTASVIGARQGKKAILVFWATWCPHCYEELATINDRLESIEHKGIKIILVNEGETKEDVLNYFDQHQMKLISFLDEDNSLQDPYHLIGVPTVIGIDAKGIIRHISHEFPADDENYFSVK